jgi:NAD(P)-dependent dehydrogenase (short-subunit alcohol dehydrogenase family)
MTIKDHTAVITGATGGLGSVLARDLAALGIDLVLLDRETVKLEALAGELKLPDSHIFTRTVDLLDSAAVKAVAGEAAERFTHLDILLHVVGGWTGGKTLLDLPHSDLEFMLNQHVWTSFNVVQAFVPYLVQHGWGRIVMITSPFAARPSARGGPYSIGKAGQESLMLTLSRELQGTGVTANLLQAKTIDVKREKLAAPTPENASWTTPEELSAAVQYLISDEAGTLNGARLPMFGGSN